MQFDGAAAGTADPVRVSIFQTLSATTGEIPGALINAYSELFEDLRDSELYYEMLGRIGISWWPGSATSFVEGFITLSTGGQ
jgi:hypothetical protein